MMDPFTVKKIRWIVFICSAIFSSAFAYDGHFYLGAEYGKSFAHLTESDPTITYYNNYLTDAYPLNNSNASTAMEDLKGGYEFSGAGWRPAIAVGLGIYNTPNAYQYSGQLIETAQGDPSDTLYDDQFSVRSMRVMAETKFTWNLPYHVEPFAEMGLGSSWNHFNAYNETVAGQNGYVALPGFQSHTSNNFAYQAGLGVGYGFNFKNFNVRDTGFQHERVSLGYRFADLGHVGSDTRGAEYPYSLQVGRLRTNDVYLNFTHLF